MANGTDGSGSVAPGRPAPWLHIVGIGEDGMDGLSPLTREVVASAEVIIGGDRHYSLAGVAGAERVPWPKPFDAMIDRIRSYKGQRVVVLVTGDPLWYSAGARIGRTIDPAEITYHPNLSAFQLAAVRMGWSMADVETLTVHGRPVEQMIAFIQPGLRLLVLTTGSETPSRIAEFLTDRGYGQSPMTVFSSMGGPREERFDGLASEWDRTVPSFNTLAVECVAAPDAALQPRVPGLSDDLFVHDGTMTKREVRAVTLARLMPMRGALLWDIGCGCGSVAIEWLRATRHGQAVGIEPRRDRRVMAAQNALALGTPGLELIDGQAPEALAGLERPDAVFIGGGLSSEIVEASLEALRPLGRLACNAVTLETEGELLRLQRDLGGELVRLQVSRAAPVGTRLGWHPQMAVTQWSVVKR